jgi:hypothetical protein
VGALQEQIFRSLKRHRVCCLSRYLVTRGRTLLRLSLPAQEGMTMTRCILNVTTHEYDKILQLNHDGLVWDNRDEELLHGLEGVLGEETVNQLRQYDQCKMQKHDTLNGLARVKEDDKQELEGSDTPCTSLP